MGTILTSVLLLLWWEVEVVKVGLLVRGPWVDKMGPQGRSVAFEWQHTWDRKAHCPWHMHGVLVWPSKGSPCPRHILAPPWGCCHQPLWVVAVIACSRHGQCSLHTVWLGPRCLVDPRCYSSGMVSGGVCRQGGWFLSVPQEDVLTMSAAQQNLARLRSSYLGTGAGSRD